MSNFIPEDKGILAKGSIQKNSIFTLPVQKRDRPMGTASCFQISKIKLNASLMPF